jgi:integrase
MPEWKPEILRRLAPLKLSPAREEEIAEEIAQHLEDRYQELLATGQSEDAAFRTAIDELKENDFLARSLSPVEGDLYREPIALGKGSSNFFFGIQDRPTVTRAEVEAFIAGIIPRYKVLVALLAGTGLRIGEALGLKTHDLGPECRVLHVRRSV